MGQKDEGRSAVLDACALEMEDPVRAPVVVGEGPTFALDELYHTTPHRFGILVALSRRPLANREIAIAQVRIWSRASAGPEFPPGCIYEADPAFRVEDRHVAGEGIQNCREMCSGRDGHRHLGVAMECEKHLALVAF
jgi:hypothetical protein